MSGSITLGGGGGYTEESPCHGYFQDATPYTPEIDFTYFREGAPVKVLDAAGTIIGSGSLGAGKYQSTDGTCRFRFKFGLDEASNHYQLVMGEYPPYDFDNPTDLDLQIGGRQ